MTGDGGDAFPHCDLGRGSSHGMTLRDYLAAAAMQGWLDSYDKCPRHPTSDGSAKRVAEMSYAMADEMLLARGSK